MRYYCKEILYSSEPSGSGSGVDDSFSDAFWMPVPVVVVPIWQRRQEKYSRNFPGGETNSRLEFFDKDDKFNGATTILVQSVENK